MFLCVVIHVDFVEIQVMIFKSTVLCAPCEFGSETGTVGKPCVSSFTFCTRFRALFAFWLLFFTKRVSFWKTLNSGFWSVSDQLFRCRQVQKYTKMRIWARDTCNKLRFATSPNTPKFSRATDQNCNIHKLIGSDLCFYKGRRWVRSQVLRVLSAYGRDVRRLFWGVVGMQLSTLFW